MRQTKTTGAGKRVRELPIFVSATSYVLHGEWIETGFHLVKLKLPRGREFVFPQGVFYGGRIGLVPVTYAEAFAGSQEVMKGLESYEQNLIPSGWERF